MVSASTDGITESSTTDAMLLVPYYAILSASTAQIVLVAASGQ
jgi:hypothetical protein